MRQVENLMPRPPKIDAFDDIRFITSYFLAGCTPPSTLVIDLSLEPEKELALLILTPDISDIVQEVIGPGSGRGRKPARHGKKHPRRLHFPDTSQLIGSRIRAKLNPFDALNFGATRFLFRLWNIYEGVSFTAAVVEGLTDIGFEHLWGILTVNPNYCREFQRFQRSSVGVGTYGLSGGGVSNANLSHLDANTGFLATQFTAQNIFTDFRVSFSAHIKYAGAASNSSGYAALHNITTGEMHRGTRYDLGPEQTAWVEVTANFKKNEICEWGFSDTFSFIYGWDMVAIGYTNNLPFQ